MTDQELKDMVASLIISQNQTDKQMKQTDKRIEKTHKEISELGKSIKKLGRKLDGMGVTQGDISEDIMYENIDNILSGYGKEIIDIHKNLKVPGKVELDLVCVNCTDVFVVEVKTRLTVEHIKKFLEIRLPRFRKYCTNYEKYKLYGMVAGRTITEGAKDYANKKGLYVIKELHEGNAQLLNEKKFEPIEYIF